MTNAPALFQFFARHSSASWNPVLGMGTGSEQDLALDHLSLK